MSQNLSQTFKRILRNCNYHRFHKCNSSTSAAKKVFLHDYHAEKNAKFVNFAGYLMPLQYGDLSLSASHKHTREHVSVFDVSHMLQTRIVGKDRVRFIEGLVVSDIQGLGVNQGLLTVFTTESGGIIDDLILTKREDCLYIVSNAGCRDKDLAHITSKIEDFRRKGADVSLEILSARALLAVQGPGSAKVLQEVVECDMSQLTFMTSTTTQICGVKDCLITRCGYTGEDGVEISIPASHSKFIIESILSSKADDVKLAGLGARDSLRLEAGLCLYGQDITDHTTPVEAGLTWTIGKRRRESGGFPGDSIILRQLKEKPAKRRVGFLSESGPCPRTSTPIMSREGEAIGEVTSGCPSPYLKKNISMGYVRSGFAKAGTNVTFHIHKRDVAGHVAKMPFVPTKYFVPKK